MSHFLSGRLGKQKNSLLGNNSNCSNFLTLKHKKRKKTVLSEEMKKHIAISPFFKNQTEDDSLEISPPREVMKLYKREIMFIVWRWNSCPNGEFERLGLVKMINKLV